jgi:predicted esterase
MNKILLISLFFIFLNRFVNADPPNPFVSIPCPQPNHLGFTFEVQIGDEKVKLPFALYLPVGYENDKNRQYPMVVFLHGGSEIGTDLNGCFPHGVSHELLVNPKMAKNFPFIICTPQTNVGKGDPTRPDVYTGWDGKMIQAVAKLVKILPDYFRIDRDSMSITGLSMGGNGSWAGMNVDPDLWAAAVPFSGRALPDPETFAVRMRFCSIWIISGILDTSAFVDGARKMHKALINAGCESQLRLIPNVGHWSWLEYYNNHEFYQWLIRQKRPTLEMQAQAKLFHIIENDENALCGKPSPLIPRRTDNKGLVPGFDGQWFQDLELKNSLVRRIEKSVDYKDNYNLPGNIHENISLRLSGWVKIEKAGLYSFITTADDGSRLTIGSETIIDDWVPHGAIDQIGNVSLKPGYHKITIEYFQGGGPGSISIFWATPDFPRRLLTEADVFCEPIPK